MTTDEDISYREYRTQVVSIAEHVEDRVSDEDTDVGEAVWEEIDSHQWIIYTSYNLEVLKHSDRGPEEWKHLVGEDSDYQEVLQAMAYKALENDVWEELNRRGNIND